MGEMTYNKLSGWVKVDGVRVGQERKNGRVLRVPAGTFNGVPAFRMIPEQQWIVETETAITTNPQTIIHLNGDPFDNRWKNLRVGDAMEVAPGNDQWLAGALKERFRNPLGELLLMYVPETGEILANEGDLGSRIVMVDDRPVVFWAGVWFAAEEVAWFLGTGVWPERGVKILNGEYCDLRLENLRRIV
jgi:hypothetical protein